ncbi:MAG: hypothetical protein HY543_04260 [Deltaproteobacteria bacterium]|nr:hypothetical protein [Deltaproteobacteria bacterium]
MSRVRKQFILDSQKIRRVRKILGAETDTEAVDEALNLVIANTTLLTAHRKMAGRYRLKDMDQSHFDE